MTKQWHNKDYDKSLVSLVLQGSKLRENCKRIPDKPHIWNISEFRKTFPSKKSMSVRSSTVTINT